MITSILRTIAQPDRQIQGCPSGLRAFKGCCMPDLCPNLPDELDRFNETIADVLRTVGRSSGLPVPMRARLIAALRRMERLTADCQRVVHDCNTARRGPMPDPWSSVHAQSVLVAELARPVP